MEPMLARTAVEFTVYVNGDRARLRLVDEHGNRTLWDMSTEDARDFFKRGVLATEPPPRTLGRLLMRRIRDRRHAIVRD